MKRYTHECPRAVVSDDIRGYVDWESFSGHWVQNFDAIELYSRVYVVEVKHVTLLFFKFLSVSKDLGTCRHAFFAYCIENV